MSTNTQSGARDRILAKIRKGLDGGSNGAQRQSSVDQRIAGKHRHLTPERVAGKSHSDLVGSFRGYLEACSATVVEVDKSDIPITIAKYLRDHNLPSRVRVGSDAYLESLAWDSTPALERLSGRAEPKDEVSLSHAAAGIAETGTLVLASGADNPVTLNFLPETHVVVVEAKHIVGPYEDALARINAQFGARTMPRTVNMISGPSRTGDIGGKLVMGAHGPRRLCVVIVKD